MLLYEVFLDPRNFPLFCLLWVCPGSLPDTLQLSEADFGEYRLYIGGIAIFIGVSSYVYVRDFLAVRALCILVLFYSREVLDAAFLQEPVTRLFLVSIIYLSLSLPSILVPGLIK